MNQATANNPGTIAASAGNAALRGLGIAITVLLLAVGAWWWWSSQRPSVVAEDAATPAATAVSSEVSTADPYERARVQIAADQIARPAGDNAIETYLQLLAGSPEDNSARQALTELLPFASRLADQAAAAGDDGEVLRLIGLIERADPSYAQLPALRTRAEQIEQARAAQQERELERAAAQERTAAAAAAAPIAVAPTPTATATPPATSATTPAASTTSSGRQTSTTPAATAAVPPAPVTPRQAPPPLPPTRSSGGSTVDASRVVEAQQINTVAPQYPPQALSRRLEGWVDVELVIDVRGMPRDVSVVGAQPANVFNREAQRAATRWRFKPRSIDGEPVESRLKRRINFRLPR